MHPPQYSSDPRVVRFLAALDRYRQEIYLFCGVISDESSTFFRPRTRRRSEPIPESVDRVNRIMRSRDAVQETLEDLPNDFRTHEGSDWVSEIVTLDQMLKDYKYRINPSDLIRLRNLVDENINKDKQWWWYITEPSPYIAPDVEDKLLTRFAAILGTANLSIIGFLWDKVTLVLPVWGVGFLGSLGGGLQAYYLSSEGRKTLNDIWLRREIPWRLPKLVFLVALGSTILLISSAYVIPSTFAQYRLFMADRAIIRQQAARAERHLDIAEQLNPDIKGRSSLRRGFITENYGNQDEAIAYFEYAAKTEGYVIAHIRIGALLIKQGDPQQARRWLRLGFRVSPVTPEDRLSLYRLYALALSEEGNYVDSLLYSGKGLDMLRSYPFPNKASYQLYCIQARSQEGLHQYELARRSWSRCIESYESILITPLPQDSLIEQGRSFCDRLSGKVEEYLCD